MVDKQIKLIRPKKRVNPKDLLEEALEILNINQKNMFWKVQDGKTLNKTDVNALMGTIRALATLKDVQLKELELEKKISEMESDRLKKLGDKEFKEEILRIAEEIKDEENNEK